MSTTDFQSDYLVLGSGMAAATAAFAAREADPKGSICVVTDEALPIYSKPMLTKSPLRTFSVDKFMVYRKEDFAKVNIELLLDARVESMDTAAKTVKTKRGEIGYDKCIYALGAHNFIPPVKGVADAKVVSIRTADDIYKMKRFATGAKKAAVIGGGVIGLEAAFELSRYGLSVNVFETLPFLMPRLLDEGTAEDIKEWIKSFDIYTGVNVTSIETGANGATGETGANGATGETGAEIVLKDGRRFRTDFTVFACGIRANLQVAENAGIICSPRGVVIDEYCRTSAKDVFACGDCAEFEGVNSGLWDQAVKQGETAGKNAAGINLPSQEFDSSMVLNTEEIAIFALGDTGKDPERVYETEIIDRTEEGRYGVNPKFIRSKERKFYSDGKMVGATIIGNLENMEKYREEIRRGEQGK